MKVINSMITAGFVAAIATASSAQQAIQIESSPTYKTMVPLPKSVTGDAERTLELFRNSDGSVDDMRIIDPSATTLSSAGCSRCIYFPNVGCVPVGCGGGTLSTGELVFLRVAPSGEGSGSGAPLSLEAINVLTGDSAMIAVPGMILDENGEASLATE